MPNPLSGNNAALVGIYGALGYDIISATNSSPQTTEINAQARADTLMKWVHIGIAQAILFAAIGVAIEVQGGRPWWPPALGSGLALTLLYAQYVHAKQSGLANGGATTEHYG